MNTKYYKTWEEYKALHPEMTQKEEQSMVVRTQTYEEMMFGFVMFLCF